MVTVFYSFPEFGNGVDNRVYFPSQFFFRRRKKSHRFSERYRTDYQYIYVAGFFIGTISNRTEDESRPDPIRFPGQSRAYYIRYSDSLDYYAAQFIDKGTLTIRLVVFLFSFFLRNQDSCVFQTYKLPADICRVFSKQVG